jgi:hypothetical protein
MIFYAAGVSVAPGPLEELIVAKHARRLFTYFHHRPGAMGEKDITWWLTAMREGRGGAPRKHLLDSGAYSAWKNGLTIKVDDYAAYVLSMPRGMFSAVVNLDVIPGEPGHVPSQTDIDRSAEIGWENYAALKRALGDRYTVLHVYHQGEHLKWLRKLMDESPYFGVSPDNSKRTNEKMAWLDTLMPTLTDARGTPLRKFHGFGVTAMQIIDRYPWYSIDSTSWRQWAMYGMIFYTPSSAHQRVTMRRVAISDKNPQRPQAGSWHYDRLAPDAQRTIRRHVESKGYTFDDLRTSLLQRDHYNLQAFIDFFAEQPDTRFAHASAAGEGLL